MYPKHLKKTATSKIYSDLPLLTCSTRIQQSTQITKSIPFPLHVYKKLRIYISSLSQQTRVSSKYLKNDLDCRIKPLYLLKTSNKCVTLHIDLHLLTYNVNNISLICYGYVVGMQQTDNDYISYTKMPLTLSATSTFTPASRRT